MPVKLPADLVDAVMAYARALDAGEAIATSDVESAPESIALKAELLMAREQLERMAKRLELTRRLLMRERDRPRVRREELDRIVARLLDTQGLAVRKLEDAELWDFAKPIPREGV